MLLRSSGYQPGALLLSYRTMADGVGIAPTQPKGSLGFRDRGITTLPTIQKLAARVGLAPTPNGLTGRRATLTPSGNGAAGRILTCIVPLRRRMPGYVRPRQQKWSEQQDFRLRPPGPKPGALNTELRSDKM